MAQAEPAAAPALRTPVAPTPEAGLTPQYGGILKVGREAQSEQMFFVTVSGGGNSSWVHTVSDPLVEYGPDSEPYLEKSLAQSWDIGQDGQTITFHLRQGVKFHDGTPYNARAHEFNLEWALDPKNSVIWSSQINSIDRVDALDDYTLQIHTSRVYAPIITNLGLRSGLAFSPTAFQKAGRDGFATKPVGTGPFMVKEWVPGSYIDFERFQDYWNRGKPYLDGWQWQEIPDERVRAAGFRTGQLDMIELGSGAVEPLTTARGTRGAKELKGYSGPTYDHFNASRAPFNDKRVRCALQMAMDRDAWNKAIANGEGTPYRGQMVPINHWAAFVVPEEEFPYRYDPEKARQMIEEYAREKGLTLPIDTMGPFTPTQEQIDRFNAQPLPAGPIIMIAPATTTNVARAEVSKAFYEAIGFKIEVLLGGGNEERKTFVTKEAGFSLRGVGLRPHPSGTLDSYMGYGGYWNMGAYNTDPKQLEVQRLLEDAARSFDLAVQADMYKQAQKIWMEECFGGVKTANLPSYWFVQPWVKWAGGDKWMLFPSDNNAKFYFAWLER